jgi:hypothetical protein
MLRTLLLRMPFRVLIHADMMLPQPPPALPRTRKSPASGRPWVQWIRQSKRR